MPVAVGKEVIDGMLHVYDDEFEYPPMAPQPLPRPVALHAATDRRGGGGHAPTSPSPR